MNKKLTIRFEIERKNILNANVSKHRYIKGTIAKNLRATGYKEGSKYSEKFKHYDVDVLIYPPTRRRFDPPNLYPTVKHLIDGLTDSKLWEDDDWKHLNKMSFAYGGNISGTKDLFIFDLIIKEIN
mgnify:FL=1